AGPGGATEGKPVGLVWFGIQIDDKVLTFKQIFTGDRAQVRLQAIVFALKIVIDEIK
ncbi:CinA family protein, partial [Psychrobacter sp. CAL495-MNA-CIBAN-0180]|uniref:CinA family protein n=1 Tax=Psychrobacter sp. CAL495-MNA-CIBAN-0180 TaxID=3140454 RepID=UPI00332E5A39